MNTITADELYTAIIQGERDFSGMTFEEDLDLVSTSEREYTLNTRLAASAKPLNFRGAALKGFKFLNGHLRLADFTGATLTHAYIPGANLSHAKFVNAELNDAILSECDLSSASFGGADLTGTRLFRARLHETQLIGALNLEKAVNIGSIEGRGIHVTRVQANLLRTAKERYESTAPTYKIDNSI